LPLYGCSRQSVWSKHDRVRFEFKFVSDLKVLSFDRTNEEWLNLEAVKLGTRLAQCAHCDCHLTRITTV